MTAVLQAHLPFAPWADPRTRRLPGVLPLNMAEWLQVDDAYTGQMALRDELIAARPTDVVAALPMAKEALAELCDLVLRSLPSEFGRDGHRIRRPDGVALDFDPDQPLHSLGRVVQEDLCLMQEDKRGEHLLSAAVLCFPAGWTLSEKIGKPLMRIHDPVAKYTDDVGRRVQRLFDAIRPETPLWRANAHYSRAPLFNPLSESAPKDLADQGEMPFIRSERQCLIRLPQTRAVVFSIHTYLVNVAALTPQQKASLREFPIHRAA